MMYRSLLAFLALAATVKGEVHDIDVGEDGSYTFKPDELTAQAGDQLRFHFYSASGPHNVVRGSLDAPGACQPVTGAFFSGRLPGDSDGHQIFTVNVTSNDPIYFYCSVASHCQAGMVGVVNPPPGGGVSVYRQRSRSVEASSQPLQVSGGVVGVDSGNHDNSPNSNSSATTPGSRNNAATPTPISSGPAASPTPAANTTPSSAGRNGQGTVVLALAVILGGLVALMA